MSGDPYMPDDEAPDEAINVGDASVPGVRPVVLDRESIARVGVPLRPANARALGVELTPLDYDPRDPRSAGVALTRLPYDPRDPRTAGSTGREEFRDDVAKAMCEHSPVFPDWLGGWLHRRAARGLYPPSWAASIAVSRGRPDIAHYCAQLSQWVAAATRGG